MLVVSAVPVSAKVWVTGRGVDIIDVEPGRGLYNEVRFPDTLPKELENASVATFHNYPVPKAGEGGDAYDTRTDQGIDSLRAEKAGRLLVALATDTAANGGWELVSGEAAFRLQNGDRYWLYRHEYPRPEVRVDLPSWSGKGREHPPFVIADRGGVLFENPLPLDGVIIDRSGMISNVNLIVMPDGSYLANCSGVPHWKIWKSTDKGATWQRFAKPYPKINFQALFEHRGDVFLLGREKRDSGAPLPACAVIYKSGDGGKSWSDASYIPVSIAGGVRADSAPAHTDIANGRLWRAVQGKIGEDEYSPGLLSAPVDADLMDPASWTYAAGPPLDKGWITTSGRHPRFWDEGTTIVTREGVPGNLAKTGIYRTPKREGTGRPGAAFVYAETAGGCAFSPKDGFVDLPGAGSKFTIRYDAASGRYWALTSGGPVRSRLDLYSSADLATFEHEKRVLHGPSSRFHGFNYPFMQIDGDDIVFVLRTAFETKYGQAKRWHDAPLFTFHKIRGFRDLLDAPPPVE